MDRYILSLKMTDCAKAVEAGLNAYDTISSCEAVSRFSLCANNWYIRRHSPAFLEGTDDKQQGYDTLYTVLHLLCRAVAPVTLANGERKDLSGLTNQG